MSPTIGFAVDWAGETLVTGQGLVVIGVPADRFPATVNEILPRLDVSEFGVTVLADGAWPAGEWESDVRALLATDPEAVVTWPRFAGPLLAIRTETLRKLGGLDERVRFTGWAQLLVEAVTRAGGSHFVRPWEAYCAEIEPTPAMLDARGAVYYELITDQDMVERVLSGAS